MITYNKTDKGLMLSIKDTSENLVAMKQKLNTYGFYVNPVISGDLSLKYFPMNFHELVFFDVRTVEMDCNGVLEQLERNVSREYHPIIFLSSMNDSKVNDTLLIISRADFLTKQDFNQSDTWLINSGVNIRSLYNTFNQENEHETEAPYTKISKEMYIPICSSCNRKRDNNDVWASFDMFKVKGLKSVITHGICPECIEKLYPELFKKAVNERHCHLQN